MTSLGLIFTVLCLNFFQFPTPIAYAAALTTLSDSISSVKVSTAANNDISFVTPTGVAASQTIIITFPATWVINASTTYTDVDVLDDGTNVTLADNAGLTPTWGVARTSATVLTLTNGTTAVAATSVIRIKIGTNATNQSTGVYQITNGSNTGSASNGIAITGSFGDTGTISIPLIANDTVAVTATVPQAITFSVSTSTIYFGTLDSTAARYASSTAGGSSSDGAAHSLAVSTNGSTGYTITVKGGTLTSGSSTITAIGATPAASAIATEQFGISATKTGGTNGTIAAPYATGSSFGYDATSATSTTFASGTSATATETYSLHYIANIAATTEAGAYSTTLTYVATANF